MSERAALVFPYAVAAILPLVGLIFAIVRLTEKRTYDAGLLLACSVLGSVIYAVLLG
ncbi:hypothetical protein [Paraconexibacter sp.]|uniref:hypothetical protein n=1 Tax=Paraconexibacter sp. TaxID=2949640 RepID=UPI0035681A76